MRQGMVWAILLVSMALLLTGCSAVTRNLGLDTPTVPAGPDGPSGPKVGCVEATPTAATPVAASDAPLHQVGDTAEIGRMAVTVTSIHCPLGVPGNAPDPGNEFMVVEFTVVNNDTRERTLSSKFQARLRDATGREYNLDSKALAISGGAPLDGQIPAGGRRETRGAFQVPAGAPGLIFLFSSHPFTDDGVVYFDVRP